MTALTERPMTATGDPHSAADAYRYGADAAAAIARQGRATSGQPAYVRAERVEHLARDLRTRADEAADHTDVQIVCGLALTPHADRADMMRGAGWRTVGVGGVRNGATVYVLERDEPGAIRRQVTRVLSVAQGDERAALVVAAALIPIDGPTDHWWLDNPPTVVAA